MRDCVIQKESITKAAMVQQKSVFVLYGAVTSAIFSGISTNAPFSDWKVMINWFIPPGKRIDSW
jgi:hypothetical protein